MAIQINGTDVVDNNRRGIFVKANPGTYTNSNRPSASTGDIIYNSDEQALQVWTGSAWKNAGAAPPGPLPDDISEVITSANGVAANPQTITLDGTTNLSSLEGATVDMVQVVNNFKTTNTTYTPVTNTIASVSGGNTLTFQSPCPDLKYFQAGDKIQPGGAYTKYTNPVNSPSGGSFAKTFPTSTYGNGVYVFLSDDDRFKEINITRDGTSWESRDIPANRKYQDVVYGDGRFVAVGTPSNTSPAPAACALSFDGYTWAPISTNQDSADWTGVAHGQYQGRNAFLAVHNSAWAHSFDGVTWNQQTDSVAGAKKIAYGNGVWVTVGVKKIGYSSDGVNWSSINTGASPFNLWSTDLTDVAFFNGVFMAVTEDKDILTSSNGSSWTLQNAIGLTNAGTGQPTRLAYGDVYGTKRWFLGIRFGDSNDEPVVYSDNNGVSWSQVTGMRSQDSDFDYVDCMIYANGQLILTNGSFYYWLSSTGVISDGADIVVNSRNTGNNTMVTSGGSWTGANGSSSGTASKRQTVVTGPAKAGRGVLNNTSSSAQINNSNGQFIDNTNSNEGADHSGGSAKQFNLQVSTTF